MASPVAPHRVAADLAARLRACGLSADEGNLRDLLDRRAHQLCRAMNWTPDQAWDYLAQQGIADIALLMTTA